MAVKSTFPQCKSIMRRSLRNHWKHNLWVYISNKKMEQNEEKGLTTEEALTKLSSDIDLVLRQFYTSQKNR